MTEFSETEINAAWELADVLPRSLEPSADPASFRVLWPSGVTIKRDCFNKRGTFGWTIKDGQPVPFAPMTMMQVAAALEAQRTRGTP